MSVTPRTIEEIVLVTGAIEGAFWRHDCAEIGGEVLREIPLACIYCGGTCHEVMRALWKGLYSEDASTSVSSGAASGSDSVRNVLPAPDEERWVEISPAVGVPVRAEIEKATTRAEERAEILGAAIALKKAANEYAQNVSDSGSDLVVCFARLAPEFERVARSVVSGLGVRGQTAEDGRETAETGAAV